MAENKDQAYLDKIYGALESAYKPSGAFTLSKDEFINKISSDSTYATKIHGALENAYGSNGTVAKGAFTLDKSGFMSKIYPDTIQPKDTPAPKPVVPAKKPQGVDFYNKKTQQESSFIGGLGAVAPVIGAVASAIGIGGDNAKLKQDDIDYLAEEAGKRARATKTFDKSFYSPTGKVNDQYSKAFMNQFLSNVGYKKSGYALNDADRDAVESRFNDWLSNQKSVLPTEAIDMQRQISKMTTAVQKQTAMMSAATPEQKAKVEKSFSIYEKPQEVKQPAVKPEAFKLSKSVFDDDISSLLTDEMKGAVDSYLLANPGERTKYLEYTLNKSKESQIELLFKALEPKMKSSIDGLKIYNDKGMLDAMEQLSKVSSDIKLYSSQLDILKKQIDQFKPKELSPEQKRQFDIDKGNFQVKDTEYTDLSNQMKALETELAPVMKRLNEIAPYAQAGQEQFISEYNTLYGSYKDRIDSYNSMIPDLKKLESDRNLAAQGLNKYVTAVDGSDYNQYKESIAKYNKLVSSVSPLLQQQSDLLKSVPKQDMDAILKMISDVSEISSLQEQSKKYLGDTTGAIGWNPVLNNEFSKTVVMPFVKSTLEFTSNSVGGIMKFTSDAAEALTGKSADYYSGADFWADAITKGFDLSGKSWTDALPGYRMSDFTDPNTGEFVYSPKSIIAGTSDQLGVIASAAIGTMAMGGAGNASVVAPMFFATYESNKKLVEELGYTGRGNVMAAASLFSLIEGVSELILPDVKLFGVNAKKAMFKKFIDNFNGRGAKYAVKEVLVDAGKEYSEEVVVELGKSLTTAITSSLGGENERYTVTTSDLFQTLVFTTLAAGIPSTARVMNTSSKRFNNAMMFEMSKDLESSISMIDAYSNLGKIDDTKADQLKRQLTVISAVQGNIPQNISEPKRIAISGLYANRSDAEQIINDPNVSDEIKEGYRKAVDDINKSIAAVIVADDASFISEYNKAMESEAKVVMDEMNVAMPKLSEMAAKGGEGMAPEMAEGIYGPQEMIENVDQMEARMEAAEEIPMAEINETLSGLYNQLENVMSNYFDTDAGKEYAQVLLDKIDKIKSYEFAADKETKVLTETATVQTARAAVEKEVGAEVGIIQGARGPKATAQITSSDGTSGTYSIEIDGDGNVTFEQKGAAPIPVGTRKDVDKSARLVDAQFDEKGMPTSITFTVSSADGKDYTINVTPQNKLKPEKLLDLAISIRANEIGTVDPTAFDEAVRVVSQETVETTTFPNIRPTEAAPAAEVATTPTAEAEPTKPMLGKAEVKKAIGNLQKGLRAAGISVQLVEDPAEWNRIISQKGGSEKTEGIFVSAEGKIYLDRNKLSEEWGRTIIFHEGTHPIINIIRNTDPKLYNSVVRALRAEAKKNKGIADVERWSNEQPEFRREDEFITETFARIADGKIIMSQLSTGLRRLIMDLINKIGAMLGNKKAIAYTDYKNAVQLAKRITNVVKRGQGIETVVGAENVQEFGFTGGQERVKTDDNPVFFENAKAFANESSFDNKVQFKKALQDKIKAYEKKLKKKYGDKFDLEKYNDALKKYLVETLSKEAANSIDATPHAIGWYGVKTRAAISIMALIHPELKTDANALSAFIFATAVTSNGNKVDKNFEYAEEQYRYFRDNGRFNEEGEYGAQQVGIKKTFKLINLMLDQGMSMSDINEFFISKFKASDLKYRMPNGKLKSIVSGELADEEVFGAMVLGPKIGNGFFINLWGDFSQLTMDRWFMRTWGRLTGSLIIDNPGDVIKKENKLKDLISQMKSDKEAYRIFRNIVGPISSMKMAAVANKIEKVSAKKDLREKLSSLDILNEIRKAGNNLAKAIRGEKEAPQGGKERRYIREVFNDVIDKLANDYGINIEMADLQAVLWYPEKALYESFKSGQEYDDIQDDYAEDTAPDYQNAAKKIAIKNGKTEQEISKAITDGPGDAFANTRSGSAIGSQGIGGPSEGVLKRIRAAKGGAEELTIKPKGKKIKQESAGGRVSPQQFTENVSAEVERIKAATEETGVTLNLDGTTYTEGGLVVPAGSLNVPQGKVSVDGLLNFIEQNRDKISSDIFKVGLYRFKDRPEVSYDLNIVIPNEYRDIAIEFGRLAGQESLFDLDTFENIKTGSDGKNPIEFNAEQLASIAQDLSAGRMPSVVQPSAGGRGPLSSVEETTKALDNLLSDFLTSVGRGFGEDMTANESRSAYAKMRHATKRLEKKIGFDIGNLPSHTERQKEIVKSLNFVSGAVTGYRREYDTIEEFSQAYHQAKSDGSNPELVKAVEDILTTPGYQASAGGRDLVAGTYYEPNLTTDENGNYVFFHVTDANPKSILKGIDSRKFQSLRTSREEKGLQYGIASFYTKPTDGERVVGGDKYYVTIRPEDVYPMDTDPNGYRAAAEKKVKPGTPFREEKVKKAIADAATKDGYQMAVGEWTYDRAGRRVSEIPSLRGDALVKLIPKPYTGDEAFTTGEERGITTQYPGQEYFAAKEDLSNIASEIASARSKKNKFDEVYTIADTISTYNGVVENYGEPNERIRDINQEEFDMLYSGATPTQKKALDAIADVYMAGAPQFSEGGRNPNITRPVVGQINWERSPEGKGDPAISSRNAIVQQASNDLKEGVITNEEYRATVSQNSPINPIIKFFEPATLKEILNALSKDKIDKVGLPINIGRKVALRLDIPAYLNNNTWVVSIHDGSVDNGSVITYENAARIKNVRFKPIPLAALNIAAGKAKTNVARMYGDFVPIPGETVEERGENAKKMIQDIVDDPAYVQVGMNPFRHSYFYDRNTDIGRPVISADEVIQVGGLVYAKNPVYGNWTDESFRVKNLFDKAGFPVQFSAGGRGAAAPITQATGGPMPTNVRRRGGISAASLRRVMPGQEAMDLRESILADNRSYYTPNNWAKISSKVDQLTELELIDYMDASDPQKIYDKIVVMGGPSAPIAFVKYYQLMRDKAQKARAIGNIAEAEQIEADIKDRFLDVKSIGTVAAQTLSMFRILKSTRNDAEFHTDIIEAVMDSAGGMLSKEQRDRVLKMVQDVLSTNNFYEGTADQVYADPTSATDQDLADLAIAKMWKADAVSKLNIYISILLQDRASEIYGGSVKGHLLGVSSMIISGTSNILNIPNRASELAVQRQIVRAGRMLKILTPETKTAYGKPLGSRIKGMRDAMVRLINEMKLMAKNPFKYIYNKIKSIREEIKDRPGGQTILSGAADIVVYGNRDLNDKLYGVNGQLNPWISLMRVLGKNKKPVGDFRGMIEDVKQSFKKKDFVNWLSESKGMTYDEYKNLGNKNKVDLREEFFADKLSVQPVTRSVVKDIAKASAAAAEFNFRAIALTDYVPRNIQEQIMLDRIAETLGLDGVDKALFKHDPYKYVENRNDIVSKEVLDYWYQYAAELTLTKDTFMGSASVAAANTAKFGIRRLVRKANLQDSIIGNTVETAASLAVDTLMPFVRLPMNATSYALDYAIPFKSWAKAAYFFSSAAQAKKDGNMGLASSYELSATKYVSRGMVGMAYMYLAMQLITIPGLITLGSGEDDDDEERRISKDMPRNRLNISAFNRYILGLAGQGDGDTRFRPGEDKTIDLIPMGVLGLMIYSYGNAYKRSRTKYLDQKYDPELLNRPIGENKTLRSAEWAGDESPDMFSAMKMQGSVIGYYFDQAWFLGITNWVKAFTAKGDDAEYMWNKAKTDLVGTAISSSVLFSNYAKKTSDVMAQMAGKPLPDINMAKVDDYEVPFYNTGMYKALASRNGLVDFISGIDPYQDRYISFAMFGEYAKPLKGATRSLPGTIWALNTPTREVVGDWSDMQRYYVYIYGQRNQIKLNGNYSMDLREPYLGTVESTLIPAEGIEGGGYAGKFQVPPKDYNELNHTSGRIREKLYNMLSEQWMNTTIGGVKITPEDLENPKLSNRKQIMDAKRGMAVAISESNRITKEFLRPWSLFKDEEGMTRFIGLGTVEKIQKIQAMVDSYTITYQVYDPETNTVKDSYDYLSDPEVRADLVDLAYKSIEMYVRELEKSKENFQEIQRIQKEEDANAEDLMNYINNLEQ